MLKQQKKQLVSWWRQYENCPSGRTSGCGASLPGAAELMNSAAGAHGFRMCRASRVREVHRLERCSADLWAAVAGDSGGKLRVR
jgi:hypothetical protein